MPQTTIIIPTVNSPIIDQVISSVLNQEQIEQVGEILVVGQDGLGLIPTHSKVKFIESKQPAYPSETRNFGIRNTNADLLLFLDHDCIPQPGWLARHLSAHNDSHCVVGGGILPQGNSYWHLIYNLTFFHEILTISPAGNRQYLPTLNLSIQRQVIDTVGLQDETLRRGEDVEWTTRMREAGYMPYFQPEAAVFHQHKRNTLTAVWNDCADSGYYMRQVRLRHAASLKTPFLLRYPWLVLLLSPLIATWITIQIIRRHPALFSRNVHLIPAIYLTKLAWCWGASWKEKPT